MSAFDLAALAISAAGLVAFAAAVVGTGSFRAGLRLALDLWMAAGLLRLAEPADWQRLAAAAGLIIVRQLAGRGLRAAGTPRYIA